MTKTGLSIMQSLTPTAAMGILFSAYPTVATALATAREDGVLKRLHGTPLPTWVFLSGRIGAAVVFAFGSFVVMLAVGPRATTSTWSGVPHRRQP